MCVTLCNIKWCVKIKVFNKGNNNKDYIYQKHNQYYQNTRDNKYSKGIISITGDKYNRGIIQGDMTRVRGITKYFKGSGHYKDQVTQEITRVKG